MSKFVNTIYSFISYTGLPHKSVYIYSSEFYETPIEVKGYEVKSLKGLIYIVRFLR
jgi:hypothetical protein